MVKRLCILILVIILGTVSFYEAGVLFLKILDHQTLHAQWKIQKFYEKGGVIGYWPFDQSIIVNEANRKKSLNLGTMLVDGRYGKARWFYGRPDNTVITDIDFLSFKSEYSISFWIKFSKTKEKQTILCNHRGGINFIWLENDNFYFMMLSADRQDKVLSYPFKKYDRFVHIVCTVSAQRKEAALYEDGVLKQKINIESVYHRPEHVVLGQRKNGYFLNYVLDELMIRNYAMGEAEIREESQTKVAYPYRKRPVLEIVKKVLEGTRDILQETIKSLDLLNPFYYRGKILKADLPQFHLYLSKKDIKAFNKYEYLSMEHGIVPKKVSKKRKIKMGIGDKLEDAQMELCGDADRLSPYGKKTFSIELEGQTQYKSMKKIIFVPPAEDGLLRPLLKKALERKYHYPSSGGLGVLWINEEYQGIYYFENAGLFSYEGQMHEAWGIDTFLNKLPITKSDILKEYDELKKMYAPLLRADETNDVGSREIFYRINQDRKILEAMNLEEYDKEDKSILEKVAGYFTELMTLKDNPGRECVLGNLDFSMKEIEGVKLRWESKRPELIDDRGKVNRVKAEEPAEVEVNVLFSKGESQVQKTLHFTVMPLHLKMPILHLSYSGQKLSPCDYIPCVFKMIEPHKENVPEVYSAKAKLHGNTALSYPKKSYKICMEHPCDLLGVHASKWVLIGSYIDLSFMRNQMAYDLFRGFSKPDSSHYAPQHSLIELFIDHEFQGIYEFENDVEADSLQFQPYHEGDAKHSVIYKAKNRTASFSHLSKGAYVQKEPRLKFGEYWTPYEELILFLGTSSGEEFKRKIHQVIDISNVMDFQIFLNFVNQMDGPNHNLFIARNNGPEDRFFIIPWDYDKSFGREENRVINNDLFSRLMKELPGYNQNLYARWQELRKNILSEDALMKRMDEIDEKVQYRVKRNFELWPLSPGQTRDDFVNEMREWVKKRLIFLDQYFSQIAQSQVQ